VDNGVWSICPDITDEKIFDIIVSFRISSVNDYTQWLQQTISYRSDGPLDQWASPEQTLKRRNGDCEDYAFLNQAVLRVLGYQPQVFVFGRSGVDHAVCVFKRGAYYCWIDNTTLKTTHTEELQEFAAAIFRTTDFSHISKLNRQDHTWGILFRRSQFDLDS